MNPVCFTLFGRPIYWYGILAAAAFIAGVTHLNLLAKKEGRPAGFGSEIGFWLMLAGIAGARVAYVLANLRLYTTHPLDVVRVDQGGLVFYGGLIGAALALLVIARVRREPFLKLTDFTLTALPLSHAIGRVGCFLNGCCYGRPWDGPWSVYVEGARRHPTQLYETAVNLALYGILLALYRRRRVDGRISALYAMAYAAGRFLLEFVRGDERLKWLGLNVAQITSAGLFLLGFAVWMGLRRKRKGVLE